MIEAKITGDGKGFDPNDMSIFIGAILLHTITDFRTEHDITV